MYKINKYFNIVCSWSWFNCPNVVLEIAKWNRHGNFTATHWQYNLNGWQMTPCIIRTWLFFNVLLLKVPIWAQCHVWILPRKGYTFKTTRCEIREKMDTFPSLHQTTSRTIQISIRNYNNEYSVWVRHDHNRWKVNEVSPCPGTNQQQSSQTNKI